MKTTDHGINKINLISREHFMIILISLAKSDCLQIKYIIFIFVMKIKTPTRMHICIVSV